MKKTFNKWDYLYIGILITVFIIFVLLLTKGKFLLGSTTDWSSQHVPIAEYLRTLFLENKDLLPDFAFNLGSGQNIYNFAYYGLLNPVIIFSYLLPKASMATYIMVSTSILVLASVILFYIFLRKKGFKSIVSFSSAFIFMCASPLMFHLHRHIMFINYMPFLILGLFGVDKYFDKHKSWLLTISTLMMILMSYYYSVVGILVLIIYGVYKYLDISKKITIKKLIKDGVKFMLPIFIGVLLSAVLIVPTFYVILNNRGDASVTITLKNLLLPNINLKYALYDSYGLGLTTIALASLIHALLKERKVKFLGVVLSLIICFPIFNYLFNAGMYIDAKSLIPFLPLYCLLIAHFTKDLFDKKLNLKIVGPTFGLILLIGMFNITNKVVLLGDALLLIVATLVYYKTNKKIIFTVSICAFAFVSSFMISTKDRLVKENSFTKNDYVIQKETIEKILNEDEDIFRISNELNSLENTNRVFENINYLKTTMYSSTHNLKYNNFYYDIVNNAIHHRNRAIMNSPKNYLYLLWSGNKYLITDKTPYMGYKEYLDYGKIKVYKNENAFPLAYATDSIIGTKEFYKLSYPYNQDVLIQNIIIEDSKNKAESKVQKIDLGIENIKMQNVTVQKQEDHYLLNSLPNGTINVDIKDLYNKILFIRFEILESNTCDKGDTKITINGINNKLTCKEWKYHNQNYIFDYVISTEDIKDLEIKISKGELKIKNIETYTLDAASIYDAKNKIDEFVFDKEETKGDIIEGSINVTNDGYFILNVPYDKGFEVFIDNQKTEYEKVNFSYIGFKINKGKHHIKIEYAAPYKNLGLILSGIGVILFLGEIIYERKKK